MYLLSYCQSSTQPQHIVLSRHSLPHIAAETQQGPARNQTLNCIGRNGGCGKPRAEARLAPFSGACKLEKGLYESCDQIVVVRFGDLAAEEAALADLGLVIVTKVVDEHLAVDLGGVHLRPAFP
jgi:hypothetical protein